MKNKENLIGKCNYEHKNEIAKVYLIPGSEAER